LDLASKDGLYKGTLDMLARNDDLDKAGRRKQVNKAGCYLKVSGKSRQQMQGRPTRQAGISRIKGKVKAATSRQANFLGHAGHPKQPHEAGRRRYKKEKNKGSPTNVGWIKLPFEAGAHWLASPSPRTPPRTLRRRLHPQTPLALC
jgi:hypothetical protein